MARSKTNSVLRHIRKVAGDKSLLDLADPELLKRFVARRDEAAFAALVRRHGPMVLSLSRRILNNHQDAEDAFQATFLALSRKAASLRPHKSLVGWLYSVAYRTAQKARLDAVRRRQRDGRAAIAEAADPFAQITVREAHEVLDRELHRLPVKFRIPLVLCYLEGLTRDEAAHRLDWPVSLLKTRLEQARERLRARLTSRGLALSGVFVASIFHEATASAAIPRVLLVSTIKAGVAVTGGGAVTALVPPGVAALTDGVVKAMCMTKWKTAALVLLALALLTLGVGLSAQNVLAGKPEGDTVPVLERARGDCVRLPADMLSKLGLQVADVKLRAVQPRVLRLAGSSALDPERTARIRGSRLTPFKVLKIGSPEKLERELRPGDDVRKGQVLAVVSSVDVGKKKHDLFSTLVQLKLDEAALERADKSTAAIPEALLLTIRRDVQVNRKAIERALNDMKVWDIPQDDIAAVRQEAGEADAKGKPETGDQYQARLERWSKVEIRAPVDGSIVERNIHVDEMVVEGAVNLYQVANVDKLMVVANCPEEQLPLLEALGAGTRWTVATAGGEGLPGTIDEIGYIIDPNQHTAVVKGHVDNKEHKLRAGQYVTATVVLSPPTAEVILPASALVEVDHQTFVFIQADPKKFVYEQRHVVVVRRSKDAVHVRARLSPKEQRRGFQTVRPGEQVITAGVIELKAILDDLKAVHER